MKAMPGRAQARGFTLIELLTVVGIILLLLALIFPAINAMQKAAKRTKANGEVALILHAFKQYYDEYQQWVTNAAGNSWETTVTGGFEVTNSVVLMLGGRTNAAVLADNLRQTVFLDAPPESILKNPRTLRNQSPVRNLGASYIGSFIDPWGSPYKYMCDFGGDGATTVRFADVSTNLGDTVVAVWSTGPDGRDQTPASREDDIASWR